MALLRIAPAPCERWYTGRLAARTKAQQRRLRSYDTFRKLMETYLEFASNHVILVTALMLSLLLLVFSELRRKAGAVTSIEPQSAVSLINADAVVIDLRNAEAFARGHIVNAKNIPFDELEAHQEKLAKMKAKSILAVCDAGTTSTRAVDTLRKSGMESVYGLKGGITAWTAANLPLVTNKKTKSKK
jgi:rhodanese-related sulfurtransferase